MTGRDRPVAGVLVQELGELEGSTVLLSIGLGRDGNGPHVGVCPGCLVLEEHERIAGLVLEGSFSGELVDRPHAVVHDGRLAAQEALNRGIVVVVDGRVAFLNQGVDEFQRGLRLSRVHICLGSVRGNDVRSLLLDQSHPQALAHRVLRQGDINVVLSGLLLHGLCMRKQLIRRSRKLVGTVFTNQSGLGEDIHVQVADDGVGVEGNAPLLVLVGHGVQSGLRRAGQVDTHTIGHLHEQALGSVVGQVGAVHDCHVGAIRRGQSGIERVIVAVPRSTAHTLNLDSPLVLCIELVGEDRDSRAFTVCLGHVSNTIGLFLTVAKEAGHGDGGPLEVVIADGSNCRSVNSL